MARIMALLPAGEQSDISALAAQSFMAGWQIALLCVAVLGLAGAVVTLRFMPQRDIPQTDVCRQPGQAD